MGATSKTPGRITEQQREFARQYVLLGNAAGAYRAAYDCDENTSAATIRINASRLLDNTNIALMVEHYRAIADKAFEVKVADIARELCRIAFFDLRDLMDEEGNLLPPQMWPQNVARAIQAIDVKELYTAEGANIGRVVKLRPASKTAALEMLAKWKRMLIERTEVGRPGEFEHLSDDELEKELRAEEEAFRALTKADKTAKAAVKKAAMAAGNK